MGVIGLDVGYSNLKIVVGEAGAAPRALVRPAGAAPLERLGERIGARHLPDAVLVDVDGQRWAAAPSRWPWRRPCAGGASICGCSGRASPSSRSWPVPPGKSPL